MKLHQNNNLVHVKWQNVTKLDLQNMSLILKFTKQLAKLNKPVGQ